MNPKQMSRRAVVAAVAVGLLSGCGGGSSAEIANDPYLPTMMKDPLYTWKPKGDLVRTESHHAKSKDLLASGNASSSIMIDYKFRNSGDPYTLLAEAQAVGTSAGYLNNRRLLLPGVEVLCVIAVSSDSDGITILLMAPI